MKATIFRKGNTITIEGTPEEVAQCINCLQAEYEITVTDPFKDDYYTGTPPHVMKPSTTA